MKTSALLTAGFALVAGVLWWQRPKRPVTVIPAPIRTVTIQTNRLAFRAPPGPSREAQEYATPWAALAVEDYSGFVRTLRESGCPEETVRQFTVAALGRRFQRMAEAPRRSEIRNSKYWQMESTRAGREWVDGLPRLRAELDAELAQLLGVPASEVRAGFDVGESTGIATELSAERRDELQALLRQHASEAGELEGQLPKGPFGSLRDDQARGELRSLRERQRAELAQFFGPELFERYDVRESAEAQYVRMNLPEAKSEEEFRWLVEAAREVGVELRDIMADQLSAHLSVEQQQQLPRIQEKVLARFRELSDPARAEELEQEIAAEQQRTHAEREARQEASSLADLHELAQAGGVELSDAEARDLMAAIKKRGRELDREWGEPAADANPDQMAEMKARLKLELEKVAVSVVGERGRALVEQMARREKP